MKRANAILLLTVFLVAGNVGYAGTVASPYEVGNWPGFRTAAVSYTFDDHCSNQFAIAVPMFNEFGYKLTLYPVINWGPPWPNIQNAATAGHEVGSHTMSHANLGSLTIAQQTPELANSQSTINSYIPGQQCVTIAYPYCAPGDQALTATYYIAARHCQGWIEANTPSNFYQISSLICGSAGSVQTAADFNARFVSTAASKGWCVFLIHGIDSDGGYSPLPSATLRASIQYLDARRSTFWVSTFGNAVRYIRERNDISVTELSNSGDSITLQVTDTLNNTIYNYPVTIRRPLPAGWPSANVSQNGQAVNASIVVANATMYVMFDVVPDGGDVVLSKGPYGDFISNGIVEMSDLSHFFKFWVANDCNGTVGVDLDEDCTVNFFEFTVLAGNWRQVP
jgi:oligosaccharide reducing-end xylanase